MKPLPDRVRVLIIGGGIHGVGVLHDLVSRGWLDTLLIEKSHIGAGTSSRSTKLIHGGLRYLQHIRDFALVSEGLHERRLLMNLVPDLVHRIQLLFPVFADAGMSAWKIKAGLTLYDLLAGTSGIGRHRSLPTSEALALAPCLRTNSIKKIFSFYDGQTDDLALVNRVAACAEKLGGRISEQTHALRIQACDDGWNVTVKQGDLPEKTISARYIFNAAGPWAHELLDASNIKPQYRGINNLGSHLLVRDLGLKAGLFLQSPKDQRIFFVLPWLGYTLIGTTESAFEGKPDDLTPPTHDISYLLQLFNQYSNVQLGESDIISTFSGLRWLAVDEKSGLSDTSRSYSISEHRSGHGVMYTLYGGKLTAYRALSEEIGDRIGEAFGDLESSKTATAAAWPSTSESKYSVLTRFGAR